MLSGLPLLVLWQGKHLILSCLSMGSHFSKGRNKISRGPWDLDSLVSSPLRPPCILFWPLTSSLCPFTAHETQVSAAGPLLSQACLNSCLGTCALHTRPEDTGLSCTLEFHEQRSLEGHSPLDPELDNTE